jgi:hypothetical protein
VNSSRQLTCLELNAFSLARLPHITPDYFQPLSHCEQVDAKKEENFEIIPY